MSKSYSFFLSYFYENGNGVLRMIKRAPKTKIMGLFTRSKYKQKYNNNSCVKKGLPPTIISIKKRINKQEATTLQGKCKQNTKKKKKA